MSINNKLPIRQQLNILINIIKRSNKENNIEENGIFVVGGAARALYDGWMEHINANSNKPTNLNIKDWDLFTTPQNFKLIKRNVLNSETRIAHPDRGIKILAHDNCKIKFTVNDWIDKGWMPKDEGHHVEIWAKDPADIEGNITDGSKISPIADYLYGVPTAADGIMLPIGHLIYKSLKSMSRNNEYTANSIPLFLTSCYFNLYKITGNNHIIFSRPVNIVQNLDYFDRHLSRQGIILDTDNIKKIKVRISSYMKNSDGVDKFYYFWHKKKIAYFLNENTSHLYPYFIDSRNLKEGYELALKNLARCEKKHNEKNEPLIGVSSQNCNSSSGMVRVGGSW